VVGVVYDPIGLDLEVEQEEPVEPTDSVIDPLRIASRQQDTDNPAGGDAVLTRWLWVEAAAAAWLAQRKDAEITDSDSFVPPSADGSGSEAGQ
jgi:hypothetical protein